MHSDIESKICVIGAAYDKNEAFQLVEKLIPLHNLSHGMSDGRNVFMKAHLLPSSNTRPCVLDRNGIFQISQEALKCDVVFIAASINLREKIVKAFVSNPAFSVKKIVVFRQAGEGELPQSSLVSLSSYELVYANSINELESQFNATPGKAYVEKLYRESEEEERLQRSRHQTGVHAKRCYSVGFFASGATAITGLGVGSAALLGLIAIPTPAVIGVIAGSLIIATLLLVYSLLACLRARSSQMTEEAIRLAAAQ